MCVGAACFPEIHPEAPDIASDLRFLKQKVEAGVSFLITQLFFDNERYFQFVDEARAAGIDVPIIPGIMPITDVAQIKTITGLCGACIPEPLLRQLEARAPFPGEVLQLGVVLRDAPVRRAARPRRARHPLLHAEPLARDARDPGRAAAAATVGAARGRQDVDGGMISSAWASRGCPSTS